MLLAQSAVVLGVDDVVRRTEDGAHVRRRRGSESEATEGPDVCHQVRSIASRRYHDLDSIRTETVAKARSRPYGCITMIRSLRVPRARWLVHASIVGTVLVTAC